MRNNQYWYVRVWDSDKKKYVVKAIRETSRIEARKVAIELARDGTQSRKPIERQFTFEHFATKALVNHKALVDDGQRNIGIVKAIEWALQNSEWGLVKRFGAKDIRKIKTRDYDEYMTELTKRRPDLSSSSKNSIMSAFRNVLKVARDEGVIDDLPATPRAKQQDNPRPFFSILSCSRKEE